MSRLWRRALVAWAVAVAVGGGLTLWLQDSGRPHEPYSWQVDKPDVTPTPPLRQDDDSGCPTPTDPGAIVLCVKSG
ncbi:hypothetical protein [Streptomyces sp. NPDC051642]|uniref:hypothetical protein n=1 Tax=unclassified Streptomyces TaxID=2593676 RepID=UPI00341D2D46